jgi:membrane protease YdiL (CAAX protease family)
VHTTKEKDTVLTNLSDLTKAILYYIIAFGLGLTVTLVMPPTTLLAVAFMWTPTIAVLLMQLVVTRDGYSRASWTKLGLHRPGLHGWGMALFVPLLVVGTIYGLAWGTGIAALGGRHPLNGSGIVGLALSLLLTIVVNILVASVGEEIGWRGYLFPRLLNLGVGRAMLLSGLLHAIWHFPLIFLTPLYHSGGTAWITTPLFVVSVSLAAIFFGYLRLRTNSVWPAVIAHATHNETWLTLAGMTTATPFVAEYVIGESGIFALAGYALVALWIGYRLHARTRVMRVETVHASQPLAE